ncbi:MAG: carbamate kinase [Candidatus Aenigmatarchaeota archaeon]
MKIAVIALGGNSLTTSKNIVEYNDLIQNIKKTSKSIVNILKGNRNLRLIITFGSGPQVGSLILQNEIAKDTVSPMPLNVLDAEVQGQLGYLIEQTLINELNKQNISIPVVSIITQILVDKNDQAFKNPTKPVGPFYTKKHAEKLKKKGHVFIDVGNGYRRVVPSPKPIKIIEIKTIKKLINFRTVILAAGGGGIPVIKGPKGYEGIDAVIDKDLASAKLAETIKPDIFIILTDVDGVYLNYKKPNQEKLGKVKLKDIKKYEKEGHFASGSMDPKIRAAIKYLEKGGKKVIITDFNSLEKSLEGKAGTTIIK